MEDCDLSGFRFAATYDLNPPLSDLLIVLGYAVPVEEVITPPPQSIVADSQLAEAQSSATAPTAPSVTRVSKTGKLSETETD